MYQSHAISSKSTFAKSALSATGLGNQLASTESLRCPLCQQHDWSDHRSYQTHVAEHLEQIALSALLSEADSDHNDVEHEEDFIFSPESADAGAPTQCGPGKNVCVGTIAESKISGPSRSAFDHVPSYQVQRPSMRTVWVCVDASPNARMLAGCQECINNTQYAAKRMFKRFFAWFLSTISPVNQCLHRLCDRSYLASFSHSRALKPQSNQRGLYASNRAQREGVG